MVVGLKRRMASLSLLVVLLVTTMMPAVSTAAPPVASPSASAAVTPDVAHSEAVQSLSRFLSEVQTAQAVFVQRVQEPSREGRPGRVKLSSGELAFARPNRFRLQYLKPYAQTLVADGRQIWFHDQDLEQVTVRPQSVELERTALGAIATVTQLSILEQSYRIKALPDDQSMSWLALEPKSVDATVRALRLGWRDGQLARMVVEDALGQRTEWTLSHWQINPKLSGGQFVFSPPAGVEVIRTR